MGLVTWLFIGAAAYLFTRKKKEATPAQPLPPTVPTTPYVPSYDPCIYTTLATLAARATESDAELGYAKSWADKYGSAALQACLENTPGSEDCQALFTQELLDRWSTWDQAHAAAFADKLELQAAGMDNAIKAQENRDAAACIRTIWKIPTPPPTPEQVEQSCLYQSALSIAAHMLAGDSAYQPVDAFYFAHDHGSVELQSCLDQGGDCEALLANSLYLYWANLSPEEAKKVAAELETLGYDQEALCIRTTFGVLAP